MSRMTRLTVLWAFMFCDISLYNTAQKATIHQVTTMLATSKNVLFPGHNHLLTAEYPEYPEKMQNVPLSGEKSL